MINKKEDTMKYLIDELTKSKQIVSMERLLQVIVVRIKDMCQKQEEHRMGLIRYNNEDLDKALAQMKDSEKK